MPDSTSRISRRTALSLALGTALAASLALPATAGAATKSATVAVEPLGWTIDYTAAPGQINKAVLNEALYDHGKVTFVIDDVVPMSIQPGTPCTYPVSRDHTKVSCTVPGQQTELTYSVVKLDLGDGNDTVTYNNSNTLPTYHATLILGDGKDTATNTGSFDGNEIEGGPNADTIRAGREAVVNGQGGNDVIHGGALAALQGGKDADHVYADGSDSRADGGAGNDFVYGGAGPQTLLGGTDAGKDTILGGPGNDTIFGQPGDDILYGNSGVDTIFGNDGNDKLYGGPGKDTLDGGLGRNVVHQD
ncbi:calcium-binding protein [Streptomyces xylophagus]|uniref:calcium-binding protein n=1 Tax=Streptomyces xylophagus TaxID=285514 RepID=UPI0007C4D9EE|nr:calcium-binding protein [Streptomyces xylophagus]